MDNETDTEDELPEGWEARVTTDGRVYYAKYYLSYLVLKYFVKFIFY